MNIPLERFKTTPRQHQIEGVTALLMKDNIPDGRIYPYCFGLMDQVGAGKTKQVIDTAQILASASEADASINTVVVVPPAFARGVWTDPALGEIAKHGWSDISNDVMEYSVRNDKFRKGAQPDLQWIVTNYEFIRGDRRDPLMDYLEHRPYWLVCDESWAVKSAQTAQWKAVNKLRHYAKRVTILNGTPMDTPLDMYAQMRLLHPGILSHAYINRWGKTAWTSFTQFKAEYTVAKTVELQGKTKSNGEPLTFQMTIGWQNLEQLREKIRPYVLMRKTRDCFDLPDVLDPILIEAKLTDATWKLYKQMRDEMVAWIDTQDGTASVAGQAIVKALRLTQITSGFIGGVINVETGDIIGTREISREKLDAVVDWLGRLDEQPNRLLVWCKWRPEVERTANVIRTATGRDTFMLYGQQSAADRERAVHSLHPDVTPDGPVAVVGNPSAGGAGLQLAGASMAINMSHDTRLRVLLQKNGRIDRPGQKEKIRYVDVVATGPKGQRTSDHHILAALQAKDDIATWTTATWRSKLLEE